MLCDSSICLQPSFAILDSSHLSLLRDLEPAFPLETRFRVLAKKWGIVPGKFHGIRVPRSTEQPGYQVCLRNRSAEKQPVPANVIGSEALGCRDGHTRGTTVSTLIILDVEPHHAVIDVELRGTLN